MGIAKKLVNAVIEIVGSPGYSEIRLDASPSTGEALAFMQERAPSLLPTPLRGTAVLVRQLHAI